MPLLPTGLRIAVSNTLLAFSAFVMLAVLWHRVTGTVEVAPLVANVVVAFVAAIATAFAEWRTKTEFLDLARTSR